MRVSAQVQILTEVQPGTRRCQRCDPWVRLLYTWTEAREDRERYSAAIYPRLRDLRDPHTLAAEVDATLPRGPSDAVRWRMSRAGFEALKEYLDGPLSVW